MQAQGNKEGSIHIPAKQLDLQCHNSLPDPHEGEDAREHHIRLISLCQREEHAKQQAENKRAPIP
jgi:hypothetical protein